jgi:hypothetical protein
MIKATLGVLLLVMSSTLAMAQKTTSFFSSSGSFAGSSIKCSDRSTSVYSKDGSFAGSARSRSDGWLCLSSPHWGIHP